LASNAFGSATGQVSLTVTAAPPRIVLQPGSLITNAGADVIMESAAVGTSPLHYQWLRDDAPLVDGPGIEGANSALLRLGSVTEADSTGTYQLSVSNALGSALSDSATLIVLEGDPLGVAVDNTNLTWTTGGEQPWMWQNTTTHDGVDAASSANLPSSTGNWIATTVEGPAALEFWWRPQGLSSISDVLAFHLDGVLLGSIAGNTAWQSRSFWIPEGTHEARWVFSRSPFSGNYAAFLDEVRWADPIPPSVVTAPTSRTVTEGANTTFDVAGAGTEPFTYQWQFSGLDLAGQTNASATLTNVSATQAGDYRVIVGNTTGSVTSDVAVLTVHGSAPVVQQAPASRTVARGLTATLNASAVGTPPLLVQWQFNGQDLPGATNLVLSIPNAQPEDAGNYRVAFQNEYGTTFSAEAGLFVVPVAAWGTTLDAVKIPSWIGDVVDVAAGIYHSIMLRRDGTAVRRGLYATGAQLPSPPSAQIFTEVRAGRDHDIGLTSEGTVLVWGSSAYGVGVIPAELSNNVAAVAAGDSHNLALTTNGTVVGWGLADAGQTTAPAEATNIVSIAAGLRHSLALREDGRLLAWGTNDQGRLDIPPMAAPVIAIASGSSHNMALLVDGTVVTWGNPVVVTNQPADLNDIVAIAAGDSQGLALRQDGSLITWGENLGGSGTLPEGLANVVAMAHGQTHAHAVIGDGRPVVTVHPYRRKFMHRPSDALFVRAVGDAPLTYRWYDEHGPLAGATNDFLTAARMPASGEYFVVVSNSSGTAVSKPATVTLLPAFGQPPGGMRLDAGGFHLRLTGLSGQGHVVIYASTNLIAWVPIHTNPPVLGVLDYVDVDAAVFAQRMYRAAELDLQLGALRLAAPARLAGTLELEVLGLSGLGPVVLYGATNPGDWHPLATNPPAIGSTLFAPSAHPDQPRYFFMAVEER
jgi:hypothetical protein